MDPRMKGNGGSTNKKVMALSWVLRARFSGANFQIIVLLDDFLYNKYARFYFILVFITIPSPPNSMKTSIFNLPNVNKIYSPRFICFIFI